MPDAHEQSKTTLTLLPDQEAVSVMTADAGHPKSTLRILIAEDEHLVAEALCSAVTSLGHTVLGPAADGLTAIELAKSEKPDLALLDIRMPKADGLETAAAIWSELKTPSVIVSAYSQDDYISRAQIAGVFAYLSKPAAPEELSAAIQIAHSRASEQIESRDRVRQLESTLAARRAVEQAKWKLVDSKGMTEPEAHLFLQREARSARRKIAEIAEDIISGAIRLDS